MGVVFGVKGYNLEFIAFESDLSILFNTSFNRYFLAVDVIEDKEPSFK